MGHNGPGPIIGITVSRDGQFLKLGQEYSRVVNIAGGIPVLVTFDSTPSQIAGIISGLIIPGGGDIDPFFYQGQCKKALRPGFVQRGKTQFEIGLLHEMVQLKKPVLGICYGMQLINVGFGGTLYGDIAAETAAVIDHTKGDHQVIGTGDVLRGLFRVNTSHHQAVKKIGKGLTECAHSDDGIIEALRLIDYPFLMGVQWHPERSDDEISHRLFRRFVDQSSNR